MVRIIAADSIASLLDAKEMLRREHDTLQKRERTETAFKAHDQRIHLDAFKVDEDTVDKKKIEIATNFLEEERVMRVLKESALDVDGTDTKDRSAVT